MRILIICEFIKVLMYVEKKAELHEVDQWCLIQLSLPRLCKKSPELIQILFQKTPQYFNVLISG